MTRVCGTIVLLLSLLFTSQVTAEQNSAHKRAVARGVIDAVIYADFPPSLFTQSHGYLHWSVDSPRGAESGMRKAEMPHPKDAAQHTKMTVFDEEYQPSVAHPNSSIDEHSLSFGYMRQGNKSLRSITVLRRLLGPLKPQAGTRPGRA